MAARPLAVVYVVENEMAGAERHIPNATENLGGGSALTLCGWVDVTYREESNEVPDCAACLSIVRYCKSLKL